MLLERTWEADTEHELLLAFRRIDQLAHGGEEYGFIEIDKLSKMITSTGSTPFRKEECDMFSSFAQDPTGQKM